MTASFRCPLLFAVILCLLGAMPLRAATGDVSNFALLDRRGQLHELRRMNGSAVVLFFTANGCLVARQSASKPNALRERFAGRGVEAFMVNSSTGDDRRSIVKEMSGLKTPHLPVLKDDTQGVARHLAAKRTGEAVAISTTISTGSSPISSRNRRKFRRIGGRC